MNRFFFGHLKSPLGRWALLLGMGFAGGVGAGEGFDEQFPGEGSCWSALSGPPIEHLLREGLSAELASKTIEEIFHESAMLLSGVETQAELTAKISFAFDRAEGLISPGEAVEMLPGLVRLANFAFDPLSWMIAATEADGPWGRTRSALRWFDWWGAQAPIQERDEILRRLVQVEGVLAEHALGVFADKIVENFSPEVVEGVFDFLDVPPILAPALGFVSIERLLPKHQRRARAVLRWADDSSDEEWVEDGYGNFWQENEEESAEMVPEFLLVNGVFAVREVDVFRRINPPTRNLERFRAATGKAVMLYVKGRGLEVSQYVGTLYFSKYGPFIEASQTIRNTDGTHPMIEGGIYLTTSEVIEQARGSSGGRLILDRLPVMPLGLVD